MLKCAVSPRKVLRFGRGQRLKHFTLTMGSKCCVVDEVTYGGFVPVTHSREPRLH
jgi:hypothetical protein